MEGEQFSLCWNNFHSNLSSGFNSLLKDEDLVDVTLAAGGRFMKAHKTVLSVCSPFFKELFRANPSKHPIVILPDVNYNALCNLLQFMYQGEVSVSQEEIPTFMRVAEMLKVKGLTDNSSSPSSSSESNGYSGPSRSPYLPDQRQMMKRPQRPVKKVIKPVQPLKAVESPKPPKSPHPPPAKKPHIEESPRQEEQEFPEALIKPKEEPQDDTESNSSQKFEDNSMDLSTMLDAKLGESSKWSTPEINKPQDSSTPDDEYLEVIERNNYFDMYDDATFRRRFRLTKYCVLNVLEEIKSQLDRNNFFFISPINQLLLCLRYFSTGGDLDTVAEYMNVDETTASRVISTVSEAIAGLSDKYVRLPHPEKSTDNSPIIVGVIGCTPVKIDLPEEDRPENLKNRKICVSLNTRMICDSNLQILNVVSHYLPEDKEDATILNKNPVIKNCFTILKRRFPVLSNGCRFKMETVQNIIMSGAVLHNMALSIGEAEPPPLPEELNEDVFNLLVEKEQNSVHKFRRQ